MTSLNNRIIPPSEMIVNDDGSIFHLHIKPEQLSEKIIMCGDPSRVKTISKNWDNIECDIQNREFRTITGKYRGKRITAISHGIGCDNIEIVINELDMLANFNLKTRCKKNLFTQLTIVRVGTSGGIQPESTIGSYVAAEKSIGFDGVLYFYGESEKVRDREFEDQLIKQLEWKIDGLKPYVVSSDRSLLDQLTHKTTIIKGCTVAANGFYAPQGRKLGLSLTDENLNEKIKNFYYKGFKITNFEMESSALAGLASLLGHRATTICNIIAGRQNLNMNTNYKGSIEGLIELILERI